MWLIQSKTVHELTNSSHVLRDVHQQNKNVWYYCCNFQNCIGLVVKHNPPFCRAFARSNLKVLCCARSCNSWPLEGATLWAILKGTSFLTSYDVWNTNLPSLERGTSLGSMASLIRRHHPHRCLRARTHFYRTGLSWRCSRCSKPPPQWRLNISYHLINQSHEWSACPRNLRWK